jgi:signal transduction histidine kinase
VTPGASSGTTSIDARPTAGTTVTVEIPLEER